MTNISPEQIREAIRQYVIDPEIGINVVDMGLIYGIKLEAGIVFVQMTLTSMGCPDGPYIMNKVIAICEKTSTMPVHIDLVWEPAWNKNMMSQEAQDELMIVQ
jgi:metal-sulfur cluster biosynthetic enzyme